jgi:hypothetical protein
MAAEPKLLLKQVTGLRLPFILLHIRCINKPLMRKFYSLTIAMVCLSVVSNAQISKGSTFLGGSVSFNKGEYESENSNMYKSESSGFTIRPQFGKAISTNKILGLFVNYGSTNFEQLSGNVASEEKNKTYGGGIFLRQYYPVSSRFYLFGESSLGVDVTNRERRTNELLTNEEDITRIGLAITPGISFAAGKKLHLEASLNNLFSIEYTSTETKFYDNAGRVTSSNKGNAVYAAANANGFSQLSIGLRWILPAKQ